MRFPSQREQREIGGRDQLGRLGRTQWADVMQARIGETLQDQTPLRADLSQQQELQLRHPVEHQLQIREADPRIEAPEIGGHRHIVRQLQRAPSLRAHLWGDRPEQRQIDTMLDHLHRHPLAEETPPGFGQVAIDRQEPVDQRQPPTQRLIVGGRDRA